MRNNVNLFIGIVEKKKRNEIKSSVRPRLRRR